MSQLLSSLPIGALVKDTGTTAANAESAGYQMIWRVIGKNHDANNSVTLESEYGIMNTTTTGANWNNYDDVNNLTNIANSINFSSKLSAKLKNITKYYVNGTPKNANVTAIKSASFSQVTKTAKVHLIGYKEITGSNYTPKSGSTFSTGTRYEYYANGGSYTKYLIHDKSTAINHMLRDDVWGGSSSSARCISNYGYYNTFGPSGSYWSATSKVVVSISYAPLICVSNDIRVSDTTDSDGAYTVVWNTPPRITTPSTDLGDRTKAFSTTFQVADDEADTVSATINLDSTTIQTIASVTLGADNTIAIDATTFRNLTLGSHTISIIANDGTESVTTTISFQKVSGMGISGSDGDLGNKWIQPTIIYQVYDDNDLQVDITEKIDGEIVKELEDAPLNTDITFDMSMFDYLTPEEQHTLKIEAVNADESTAERIWTFTKLYQYLEFYTDTVETDISAERIYVVLDYDKTNNPEIEVWVCNDAGGVEWHYEDATEDVLNGQPHTFHYTPAEGTEGVSVMVRLIKNANTERVYFNNIGFTFS